MFVPTSRNIFWIDGQNVFPVFIFALIHETVLCFCISGARCVRIFQAFYPCSISFVESLEGCQNSIQDLKDLEFNRSFFISVSEQKALPSMRSGASALQYADKKIIRKLDFWTLIWGCLDTSKDRNVISLKVK